jgi:hypothetical protein
VPAKALRPLSDEDRQLIYRKTRDDIPDDLYGPPAGLKGGPAGR